MSATELKQEPDLYFYAEWVAYFSRRPLDEVLRVLEGVDWQRDLLRAREQAAAYVLAHRARRLLFGAS